MVDAAAVAAAATAAQPAPWRPDPAAAKALGLLCLASLSVGFAARAFAALLPACCHRPAAGGACRPVRLGFQSSSSASSGTSRTPVGSILCEAVVRAFLAALAFALLSTIGCLVLAGLSPAKGFPTGRIAAMLAGGSGGSKFHGDFLLYRLSPYGTEALEDEAW